MRKQPGMSRIPRWIPTTLAIIFGTGLLAPLVQANVQEWAKQNGWDQFLVRFAEPATLDRIFQISQTGWFIFVAGFFVGGAALLWIDTFLRRQPQSNPNAPATTGGLAHALHMPSNGGMNVIVESQHTALIGAAAPLQTVW
jgi:apolipoprotein N-acyltransferase